MGHCILEVGEGDIQEGVQEGEQEQGRVQGGGSCKGIPTKGVERVQERRRQGTGDTSSSPQYWEEQASKDDSSNPHIGEDPTNVRMRHLRQAMRRLRCRTRPSTQGYRCEP